MVDRHAVRAGDPHRRGDVRAVDWLHQPLCGTADLERGQRRQRRVSDDRHARQRLGQRIEERAHDLAVPPLARSSSRSRAMSAAIASAREHAAKETRSPGASWPATGRSALITVAIFK